MKEGTWGTTACRCFLPSPMRGEAWGHGAGEEIGLWLDRHLRLAAGQALDQIWAARDLLNAGRHGLYLLVFSGPGVNGNSFRRLLAREAKLG